MLHFLSNHVLESVIFEAKKIKKMKKEAVKREDRISRIQVLWNQRLRDNFEVYRHKKTLKKFWKVSAFPSSIRGELWSKCIGNNLGISSALYKILVAKGKTIREAREEIPRSESEGRSAYLAEHSPKSGSPRPLHDPTQSPSTHFGGLEEEEVEEECTNREESAALISLDLERTFPTLSFFSGEGPLYHSLWNVLSAYVVYRPDIGYVQGMGYLAATLLLSMDEHDSFIAFCNLLNQHHFYDFFIMDMDRVGVHIRAFEQLLMKTLPDVRMHFDSHNVRSEVFMFEWMLTAYMKTFPLDTACRVWDGFVFEGELFLFRVALGYLKTYRKELLAMTFEELMLFLTHSKREVNEDDLFENIRGINLSVKIFDRAMSLAKEHSRSD
jgi:TBC1 domain family member 14